MYGGKKKRKGQAYPEIREPNDVFAEVSGRSHRRGTKSFHITCVDQNTGDIARRGQIAVGAFALAVGSGVPVAADQHNPVREKTAYIILGIVKETGKHSATSR